MPKLFPLPFGLAVRVPVEPETLAFQEFCRLWEPLRLIRTVQLLLPLTDRLTLNRSPHSSARLTDTVHPLDVGGGLVGVVVGGAVVPLALQDAVGNELLPFFITVMPKLLPAPFGVALTVPLVPVTFAFQEFCTV